MVKDLGLHLHNRQGALLAKLEPDDLEAAKRLYLSAYTWDKCETSLYFLRSELLTFAKVDKSVFGPTSFTPRDAISP